MPATVERVQVTFQRSEKLRLERLARTQDMPLSQFVAALARTALALAEDMSLVELGEDRLATFDANDALTTEELLRRRRTRKRKG